MPPRRCDSSSGSGHLSGDGSWTPLLRPKQREVLYMRTFRTLDEARRHYSRPGRLLEQEWELVLGRWWDDFSQDPDGFTRSPSDYEYLLPLLRSSLSDPSSAPTSFSRARPSEPPSAGPSEPPRAPSMPSVGRQMVMYRFLSERPTGGKLVLRGGRSGSDPRARLSPLASSASAVRSGLVAAERSVATGFVNIRPSVPRSSDNESHPRRRVVDQPSTRPASGPHSCRLLRAVRSALTIRTLSTSISVVFVARLASKQDSRLRFAMSPRGLRRRRVPFLLRHRRSSPDRLKVYPGLHAPLPL